jgi:ubiquinone/menaquinone biosynthesis C-methylase UbiE
VEDQPIVVISSLMLCTVTDPAEVLAEVRRVLRPGGTFRFVEHVAAWAGTPRARCSQCWQAVGLDPFISFGTQIAGVAHA